MIKRITLHVDELLTAKRDGNFDDNDVRLLEEAIIASTLTRPKTTDRSERSQTAQGVQQESVSVPTMDFSHVSLHSQNSITNHEFSFWESRLQNILHLPCALTILEECA